MTIPKTLAALPSSQYATDLLLVSGKADFREAFPTADCPIELLEEAEDAALPTVELWRTAGLDDCSRKARRKGVCFSDLNVD